MFKNHKEYSVCIFWLFGLVLGMLIGSMAAITPISSDSVFLPTASVVSVFISAFAPVLLILLLLYYRQLLLLRLLLFLKAFLYGYSVLFMFRHSGMIFLTGIYLLSSSCCAACMLYLSIHVESIQKRDFPSMCRMILSSLLAVCTIDYLLSVVLS